MTQALRFGRAEVRPTERQLLVGGRPVAIGARAFDVLSFLIANRERVVGKAELLEAVWPGLVVEENNLQVQISTLRKILGTGAIATIPGHGYQFTAALDGEGDTVPDRGIAPGGEVFDEAALALPSATLPHPHKRLAILILVAIVLAAGIGTWTLLRTRPRAETAASIRTGPGAIDDRSIAVLPFVDISEKRDQEYFSDGLSEALIDLLAKNSDLRVPARTSCFYFKGKPEDITEIARKLRVAHVLEGSVRRAGGTIRVSVQLIRADNGYHIWSETYERSVTDVFKVQDEIASAVVGALKLTMLTGSGHVEPAPANIDAYTLLLQGRFAAARFAAGDMRRAVELFEQSTRVDPSYAAAWAAIAGARRWLANYVDPTPDENVALARAAAQRALSLNPNSVEAHLVLAQIYLSNDFNGSAAASELDRMQKLEPNNLLVLNLRASRALSLGDATAASQLFAEIVDRDPFRASAFNDLALALYVQGRLQEAEQAIRHGLDLSPRLEAGHFRLTRILIARHAYPEAIIAAQQESDTLYRRAALALAYHAAGRTDEALAQLDELIAHDSGGGAYQIAEVQASRGDHEAALQWLHRAYRQHDSGLAFMNVDPLLKDLRGAPRFMELQRKLGE